MKTILLAVFSAAILTILPTFASSTSSAFSGPPAHQKWVYQCAPTDDDGDNYGDTVFLIFENFSNLHLLSSTMGHLTSKIRPNAESQFQFFPFQIWRGVTLRVPSSMLIGDPQVDVVFTDQGSLGDDPERVPEHVKDDTEYSCERQANF